LHVGEGLPGGGAIVLGGGAALPREGLYGRRGCGMIEGIEGSVDGARGRHSIGDPRIHPTCAKRREEVRRLTDQQGAAMAIDKASGDDLEELVTTLPPKGGSF
jgi:hypothetical protein